MRRQVLAGHARPPRQSNNRSALRYIGAPPPFDLHNFGCGQGSDLKKFRQIVHQPTGLEGATRLATMARAWQLFSKRRIHRTDSLIPPRRPAARTAVLAGQRVAQAGGPERRGTCLPTQAASRGHERQSHAKEPASFRPLTRLVNMVDSITQARSDVLLTKIVNN